MNQTYPHREMMPSLYFRGILFHQQTVDNFYSQCELFFMTVDNLTNFSLSDLWKTFLFYDRIRGQE